MVAPIGCSSAFPVKSSYKRLGSILTLILKLFSSAIITSRPLDAQRLAERLRAQKGDQQKVPAVLCDKLKRKSQVSTNPVQRRVSELVWFTRQLQQVHPNVLAKALCRGILHQDEDLVIVNKSYSVPVHGGPDVQLCISDVLPILAKMLHGQKAEPLHLCHRLDKETMGLMVLAWEKEVAHQVQELFQTRQVAKKYWAITVRVPVHSAGVVDIPILEKEVQGQQHHCKMTLAPRYLMDNGKIVKVRGTQNALVALTQYQVLSSTFSSALLELLPVTGVKHQLRVHLSFGLDCPVLGDHKYSDRNRLDPQKLSLSILKKLGLKQSKARHIPLHLHARQLILPASGSRKEDLNLVCKLPHFFVQSLHRLGLEMPSKTRDDEAGHLGA
ncbi:PREDICTED: RNA pseudouridylate synthase domain-containing protein 4-like [Elephantulus edwardii]|uniref:RNA pseudouridylate synthase domain-containing protein 4-like n=1 Tax=Elephantulus edwardii TaxID=28737 RepID=UPI0003F0AB35|nr:PREDICTED: RNA pseudouridylate synthase domain-containing protein 4-like [Elephantulus edwardii]